MVEGSCQLHRGSDLLNQLGDLTAEAVTLKKLCLELGDLGLTERWFGLTEDWELAAVSAATWDTLEQQGFVRRGRRAGRDTYQLTDAGWIAGLEAAGVLSSQEFLARCETLVVVLRIAACESSHALRRPHLASPPRGRRIALRLGAQRRSDGSAVTGLSRPMHGRALGSGPTERQSATELRFASFCARLSPSRRSRRLDWILR